MLYRDRIRKRSEEKRRMREDPGYRFRQRLARIWKSKEILPSDAESVSQPKTSLQVKADKNIGTYRPIWDECEDSMSDEYILELRLRRERQLQEISKRNIELNQSDKVWQMFQQLRDLDAD